MSVLLYILIISVLNLIVGFATAMYLSHQVAMAKGDLDTDGNEQPAAQKTFWDKLRGFVPKPALFGRNRSASSSQEASAEAGTEPSAMNQEASDSSPAEEEEEDEWADLEELIGGKPLDIDALTSARPPKPKPAAAVVSDDDDANAEETDEAATDGDESDFSEVGAEDVDSKLEALQEEVASDTEAETATNSEAQPALDTRAALTALSTRLEMFNEEMCRIDDRARKMGEDVDSEALKSLDQEVRDLCLAHVEQATEQCRLLSETHDDIELKSLCEELTAACERHRGEIEGSCKQMEILDYDFDPKECYRQLRIEIGRIVRSGHQMYDQIEAAIVRAAKITGSLDTLEESQKTDVWTGLPNVAGLEVFLDQWQRDHQQSLRRLTVAGIDLDRFSRINDRYGQAAGNRFLRTFAHTIREHLPEKYFLARTGGQRFFILFPEADARTAIQEIEKLRQTIESAVFRLDGETIRMTVSGAVTEATPDDTVSMLYERIDATLQEAKRYGRNRTFQHDGSFPSPVVPANVQVPELEIDISEQAPTPATA
ncbi:MAG: GGDEF domain-containing protein [Planctomycetota bacterium]|nr:MAG: GGDEF domain-containing protein [Planctomycetota bacterium]